MIPTTSAALAVLFFLNFFSITRAVPLDAAASTNGYHGSCKHLFKRKEWRALDVDEKKNYINAVKCLQSLPARNTSRPAGWTRFDEFDALHIELALGIHYVGHFLPWHRQFVILYERALRKECGYNGSQPYWNWSIDADLPNLISQSPIWDAATGFGGNGVPGTYVVPPDPEGTSRIRPSAFRGCVQDGPFANYTLKNGPGLFVTDHCLTRGFNDTFSRWLNTSAVAHTLTFPTYETFSVELEGSPDFFPDFRMHSAGHVGIGGEMSNLFSSTGEPVFFLHHANLDRVWWTWQQLAPENLFAMGGRSSVTPPFSNVTLAYPLDFGDIGPTVRISEVMDIHSEYNCYTYI